MDAEGMQDVLLEASAEVQEVMREILDEWAAPLATSQIRLFWQQMPAEIKEQFKKDSPQDYETLTKFVGGVV